MFKCDDNLLSLLRYSLSQTCDFTVHPTAEEWQQLYAEAVRQSVVGVTFDGVNRLRGGQRPPLPLMAQWAAEAEAIRGLNRLLTAESARLTRLFESEGHATAILKGQANARYYPEPSLRQPGDIDIWVSGGQERVTALLRRLGMADDETAVCYQHLHLPPNSEGIEVEVHFHPSPSHTLPRCNQRLQEYLEGLLAGGVPLCDEGFRVPPLRFALVMQLAHIRHHLRGEGIGLRQLTDYYLLLRHSTADERRDVAARLSETGLLTTARALMWVLKQVFAAADDCLLPVEPARRKGRWMLGQVMMRGNFSRYDRRADMNLWQWFWSQKKMQAQLTWFEPSTIRAQLSSEVDYWWRIVRKLPLRIKYRSLSLRRHPETW